MSAIEYRILDPIGIFLAIEHSILNFLYIIIDSFSCYFTHTEVHITPTEHISGKLVLDHEIHIHAYWLHLMLDKPKSGPYLTDWTYFWHIGTQSWTFNTYSLSHSDLTSVMYEPIFSHWTNF